MGNTKMAAGVLWRLEKNPRSNRESALAWTPSRVTDDMARRLQFSIRLGCVLLALTIAPLSSAFAADGRDIAANGNSQGAAPCAACHGDQGEGRPDAGYPRLAGLNAGYLLQQLTDFADGKRSNEIMQPIAKALSPDEKTAVTTFYASLNPATAEEPKKPDDKTVAAGAALASRGDWSKGLPGCSQCHGPAGQGVGASFPKLAGQNAAYITNELKAWQQGKRSNDPLDLMTGIATKLDDGQIAAVAAYYASLPAVAPQSAAQKGTIQ